MVNTGFENAQNRHKATIQSKYDKIKQDELDRIEAEKQKIIRKEKRREARIKRAKDQELEKFRDQIQRNVIFKGEVLEVLKTNLVEYHGFYTTERYIGALGGQANQVYYVLDEIMKKYPDGLATYLDKKSKNAEDEYLLKPNNPRELLQQEHLTVFLMAYLKDMKNESIDLSIHPLCIKYLDNLECPLDDLSALTDEELIQFKDLYLDNIPKSYSNKSDVIETLIGILINIIAKRVPVDNTSVKIDHIHHKVRFVPLPEGIIEEDYEETIVIPGEEGEEARTETIQHTKNTSY